MLYDGREFERKNLECKKVEEIRKICKECGISYYEKGKRLTKSKMIDKILETTLEVCSEDDIIEKTYNKEQEDFVEQERKERKRKYIENAVIGTIVAIKLPNGKVISAAITKKSTKNKMFMVETVYGVEYKISFDDVIWVRTGDMWPNGIYQLFKKNERLAVDRYGE